MVEAIHRLPQATTPAQTRAMDRAVVVLARRMARKKVEMMLKAKGLKPQRMERKAIMATADAYLVKHRNELFREAKDVVERWHAEGVFGPRGGIRNPVRRAD
jgi:hypothetical protein